MNEQPTTVLPFKPAGNTSTVPKQLKPFVKNDPRINRKGRPRSYEQLRKRILQFLAEADESGDGTRLDKLLQRLAEDDPALLLAYGFGRPPVGVDLNATLTAQPLKLYSIVSPDDL
jgi:hypothetical protein